MLLIAARGHCTLESTGKCSKKCRNSGRSGASASRQPLLKKPRRSHGRVKLVTGKTDALVQAAGRCIAGKHFQGQLAGAAGPRNPFDFGQHPFADPLPPVAAPHDHIVNVDQWPAGKGRKTFYAIDQPDRLLPIQRENAERLGPRSQRCHQVFPRISRQRCATAGRVARIGVKQFDNGPSLPRFLVIRDKNKNGAHPQSVKHNAPMTERTRQTVALLGTAQTLAFASTYYLPAVLATPMARDLGVSPPAVFSAFSLAMLVSAPLGPWAGRAIDHHGGHVVLPVTSLVFAAGLAALALAQGPWSLFAAWALIGVAMGGGLYEAAFSTLVRIYGEQARHAITGITLIAGFASTVGWPLSAWMEARWGWRGACAGWATAHLLLGLPFNAALPRRIHPESRPDGPRADVAGPDQKPVEPTPEPGSAGAGSALALAAVFAIAWFISTAMATHLPQLLGMAELGVAAAISVAALVGPAQVGGRLAEYSLLRHLHPLLSARLAAAAHPLGAMVLLLAAPLALGAVAPLFVILHGAGNGVLTIAKGTLPLALFGPRAYGARLGLIMTPARIAQALAPPMFGLALARWGTGALWITAALGLGSLSLLLSLKARSDRR